MKYACLAVLCALSLRCAALVVEVDGKEVYRYPLADMRPLEIMRYRIQPNGDVFPVWKIFEGTSFSGYRYRRVK